MDENFVLKETIIITDIDPWSPSFIIMGHFKNTSVSTETTFLKSNEYQTPKSKY